MILCSYNMNAVNPKRCQLVLHAEIPRVIAVRENENYSRQPHDFHEVLNSRWANVANG